MQPRGQHLQTQCLHSVSSVCISCISSTARWPLRAHAGAASGRRPLQVKVANVPGQKVDHNGIKVQLLGQIELASERGHPSDFLALSAPSSPPCLHARPAAEHAVA